MAHSSPGTLPTCGHVTRMARPWNEGLARPWNEGLREHAGYTCLGCKKTWDSLFALGQHRGAPINRGTPCGDPGNSAELRNVPSARHTLGMVRANPLFRPGNPLYRPPATLTRRSYNTTNYFTQYYCLIQTHPQPPRLLCFTAHYIIIQT